ncbi:MAG: glycosyltransferase [Candidatus Falkowbacteria bacterium]|nr:glycosyltransferase [Candidatus Falkowbacteria bacterium]
MKKRKPIFLLLLFLSFVGLVFYFAVRLYIFFANHHGILNITISLFLLLSESHSILHSLGFILGLIRLRKKGVNYHRRAKLDLNNLPSVSILVPARNEPLEVLELTFISLVSLDYQNKKLVFLDGSDHEYKKANSELAKKYNIDYFYPLTPPRSKAEIINQYLPQVTSKYLSVFDADQNPLPEFLSDTVSLLEHSKKIAFVQTPQLYSNLHVSPIARGAALQQSIFYENVCEAKGESGAMFCCGTNFLMQTVVLKKVGGFDENSVTEDFATSVKIHSLGYRSIYYNHVRVFGMAPETFPAYLKQQFRWSAGSVGVLRRIFLDSIHGKLHLNIAQKWEYFLSATYYFVGWSFLVLMLCPILFLLFKIPSYFANPYLYLGTFIPYYTLTLLTFYATMKKRHYQLKDVFSGIIMGSLSYPALIQSSTAAIFGRKSTFVVTDKRGTGNLSFWKLWPWTVMIALNIAAITNGLFHLSENYYAIGINILWCTYHALLLSRVFKLNRRPQAEKNQVLNYT